MLAHWPEHPHVALVTTDGFLHPNAELERRGLLQRKGFPESYDRRALLRFVVDIKSGKDEVEAPTYSHLVYDVVPDEKVVVKRPDIVIIEGLNVLQPARAREDGRVGLTLSDFFDFSVYVDARTEHIKQWYVDRFLRLRETAFRDPHSYFAKFAALVRGRGGRDGHPALGHHQRPQPAAERAAHPLPRHAGAAQGQGPLGPLRPAPQALRLSAADRAGGETSLGDGERQHQPDQQHHHAGARRSRACRRGWPWQSSGRGRGSRVRRRLRDGGERRRRPRVVTSRSTVSRDDAPIAATEARPVHCLGPRRPVALEVDHASHARDERPVRR